VSLIRTRGCGADEEKKGDALKHFNPDKSKHFLQSEQKGFGSITWTTGAEIKPRRGR